MEINPTRPRRRSRVPIARAWVDELEGGMDRTRKPMPLWPANPQNAGYS